MGKAKEHMYLKADFEILFKDSPDYFLVENAKMLQEDNLIRFIGFDENNKLKEETWFPINNIFRIKRYYGKN
jgi:hypothetical protein